MNPSGLVLNGPYPDMLERREPDVFGRDKIGETKSAARGVIRGVGARACACWRSTLRQMSPRKRT